jgi:hypothetical protein
MADYYPVLARAVGKLPNNSALARKEVYASARTIVAAQLRAQEPPTPGRQIVRELAALETAIRKIEMEWRSAEAAAGEASQDSAPQIDYPAAAAAPQTNPRAGGATKIFTDVQPYETRQRTTAMSVDRPAPGMATIDVPAKMSARPAPAPPLAINADPQIPPPVNEEFDGMIESIGAMLLGIAFVMGMMAFVGVIYIRGMVLVANEVIGYPTLFAVTAVIVAISIAMPLAIFRKTSIETALGNLLRLAHPAVHHLSTDVPTILKSWQTVARRRMLVTAETERRSRPVE